MAQAMAYFGMVASALMVLIFGLDMAIGIPFGSASMMMDIVFTICSLILGYMSWDALKSTS